MDVENVLRTGSQSITNYDLTKVFIGNNRYAHASFKNTTDATVTIPFGTLMGKVTKNNSDSGATPPVVDANVIGYLLPCASGNVNGEGNPVGILAQDLVVAAGATVTNVRYCLQGDFDLSFLVLNGSDTLDTVVSGSVAINELILSQTGLFGINVQQMTKFDNQ